MKVFISKIILALLQPNAHKLGELGTDGKVKW